MNVWNVPGDLYPNTSQVRPEFCVNCSAGVGRTGAVIVIDAMLERIKHEKTVDVYGHVTCLRAQRNYMVQTEDQYVFIHDALVEAIQSGNTEVPARNLYAHIQRLTRVEVGDSVSGMEMEFKVGSVNSITFLRYSYED
jgi:receptor-type tyrosine-protein phosphatase delta